MKPSLDRIFGNDTCCLRCALFANEVHRQRREEQIASQTLLQCPLRACTHKIAIGNSDLINVRFSHRPFRVKRFQTIHHYSVDVAHGLVLLCGIGTKALPSWDSRTRWNNLLGDLAVRRTVGPSGHTNSPHPSSREGHHSTARWSSNVFYWIRCCTVYADIPRECHHCLLCAMHRSAER